MIATGKEELATSFCGVGGAVAMPMTMIGRRDKTRLKIKKRPIMIEDTLVSASSMTKTILIIHED